jgi:SAM-dependent methyltransferase
MSATPHPRERFARLLPAQGAVLDVGCWSYSFSRYCEGIGLSGLRHFGVDREKPPDDAPPAGFTFALADLESDPLPFPDGNFDGVVLSHVIEHVVRPLRLVDESLRVLKTGGWLYVECPSDRSLWLPSMPFKLEESRSLNFFDDPTHVGRPQTPQSLHRLFRMYGAEVVETRYLSSWSVRLRAPWLIPKALLRRDAAMLEDVVWRTFGFAVFGIARKAEAATRRYVLP